MSDKPPTMNLDNFFKMFETTPFIKHMGIKVHEHKPGYAKLGLPFRKEFTGAANAYHGGAVVTLIDTAGAAAAWSGHDFSKGIKGSTVDLMVNYLSAGVGEDLVAEARETRRGKELIYTEVDVATASGKRVAKALVTYRIIK